MPPNRLLSARQPITCPDSDSEPEPDHSVPYATAEVKECWLVLGSEKQIEVYRQPRDGPFTQHAVHGPGGTLTSSGLPQFTLSLDAYFAKG